VEIYLFFDRFEIEYKCKSNGRREFSGGKVEKSYSSGGLTVIYQ